MKIEDSRQHRWKIFAALADHLKETGIKNFRYLLWHDYLQVARFQPLILHMMLYGKICFFYKTVETRIGTGIKYLGVRLNIPKKKLIPAALDQWTK